MNTENLRARFRELDWLWLFLSSWVLPFVIDFRYPLTYFLSLAFWFVPTLILLPRFLEYTDRNGRRRSALLFTTIAIVGLGILLDCVFGGTILQFDETPTATYVGWFRIRSLGVAVPIEEFLFYTMAPITILLVYAWADEYWLALYSARKEREAIRPSDRAIHLSPGTIAVAAVIFVVGVLVFRSNPARTSWLPPYFAFLVAFALLPPAALFRKMRQFVNWPAFGVTAMYVFMTSLIWEATLAVPRQWWGYKPGAMLGLSVDAWTRDPKWPFPLEAVLVWVACPFICILVFEYVKFWKYRARQKETFVHPSLLSTETVQSAQNARGQAIGASS